MNVQDKINIREELEQIEEVPTLPRIAFQLLAMMNDPDVSLGNISRVIEEDPPLVAKIIKIVNSGFYNVRNRVTNIHQAIVLLGLEEVKNLVFALSVYSTFYHIHQTQYFSFSQFWKHSAGTAKMSLAISKFIGLNFHHADFVAGLLHDFGRLVLQLYFSEIYESVFEKALRDGLPLYQVEKELLGFTHAEAGYWLANHWGLPEPVSLVMKEHHEVTPEMVETNPLLAIVHSANQITNIWNVSLEQAPVMSSLEEDPVWMQLSQNYPKLQTFPLEEMLKVFNMHVEETEVFVNHLENIYRMSDH